MALTAYSGEFLDELGLNDFEDVARFVPGFDVQNQSPNNPGFVMRGVTSDSGESFTEPRVSVYPGRRLDLQVARLLSSNCSTRAGRDRARAAIDPLRARRPDRRGQHHPEPRRSRRASRPGSSAAYGNFDSLDARRHAQRADGRDAPPSASPAATATATASSTICSAARISTRSTPRAIRGTDPGRAERPGHRRRLRQLPGGPSGRHLVQVDGASPRPIR